MIIDKPVYIPFEVKNNKYPCYLNYYVFNTVEFTFINFNSEKFRNNYLNKKKVSCTSVEITEVCAMQIFAHFEDTYYFTLMENLQILKERVPKKALVTILHHQVNLFGIVRHKLPMLFFTTKEAAHTRIADLMSLGYKIILSNLINPHRNSVFDENFFLSYEVEGEEVSSD